MSWNKYAYTNGDPVNFNDLQGGYACPVGAGEYTEWVECVDVPVYLPPDDHGMCFAAVPLTISDPFFQECFAAYLPYPQAVGGGGSSRALDIAQAALNSVKDALATAAATQTVFSAEQLDCISGIETGRGWNPNAVASNGRVGLFQFNENSWAYSGTGIPRDGGQSAKDPGTAATVALALLYRNLGYKGVENPTPDAIKEAIDKFGEHDGRYGQVVMDCAGKLASGNFAGAFDVLQDYAVWVAKGRP